MILIGIVIAAATGNMHAITDEAIVSGKSAVALAITMLGIVAMWTGLMKIAEESGLVDALAKKLDPVLNFLFPDLKRNRTAKGYIATNLIANFLGLGWAATPAGLKAMSELQKINPKKDTASRAMCMFLVINMSSLQIISVNLLAYRAEYNSANPAEIIMPSLVASVVTIIIAVLIAKSFERGYNP